MNTKSLMIAMLFGVAFSTMACKKCVTCEKTGTSDIEVCQKDYTTPQQYDVVVNTYEASGYNCN